MTTDSPPAHSPVPAFGGRQPSDVALITMVYVVALAGAVWAGRRAEGLPPWAVIAVADAVGTVIVFAFSCATRNASMYDPYWSVAPPAIAIYLLSLSGWADDRPFRQFLVLGFVFLWAIRLTYNWWSQWSGRRHEDWRYADLRRKTGGAFWVVNLTGIHLMPTLLVYAGCLSLLPALLSGARPMGVLDGLACLVTGFAVWIEATADRQLREFRQSKPTSEAILDTGVWAWVRHPNYLGEVLFWWGLALFGIAADPTAVWILGGPIVITALFWFISIPLIERRMLERRPHYAGRIQGVPRLFPWPRGQSNP